MCTTHFYFMLKIDPPNMICDKIFVLTRIWKYIVMFQIYSHVGGRGSVPRVSLRAFAVTVPGSRLKYRSGIKPFSEKKVLVSVHPTIK